LHAMTTRQMYTCPLKVNYCTSNSQTYISYDSPILVPVNKGQTARTEGKCNKTNKLAF
jgi:hypothetical protein